MNAVQWSPFTHVIACLAEGLGIRGTARVFEIDPNTVLHWLVEAAEQLKAFAAYFLRELHRNQVQLNELYAMPVLVLFALSERTLDQTSGIRHRQDLGYSVVLPGYLLHHMLCRDNSSLLPPR